MPHRGVVALTSAQVAALFVETGGVYFNDPRVDPWDEARDARLYDGPLPVVAHPPCARWCMLASVNEKRWGAKIGDDGGCFESALASVRRWGGILEHPAYSLAWPEFGLPRPARGGWSSTLDDDVWVAEVAQGAYGHQARKMTWLLAVGCSWLPELSTRVPRGLAVVGAGIHSGQAAGRGRVDGYAASITPDSFRELLITTALSARS